MERRAPRELFGVGENAGEQDQAALFVGEEEQKWVIGFEVGAIEHADSFNLWEES